MRGGDRKCYILSFYFSSFVRDLFPVVATNETGGRRSKSNTAGAKIKVILILETRINILLHDLRQTLVLHLLSFSRLKASDVGGCFFL